MHIHIGNTRNRFPLQTLKNIMTLYAACEAAIDSRQTLDRIGITSMPTKAPDHPHKDPRINSALGNYENAYNMPLSSVHAEQVYVRRCIYCSNPRKGWFQYPNQRDHRLYPESHFEDPVVLRAANQYTAAANVALIQRAPTLHQLLDLQGKYGHHSTVNLENLLGFDNSTKKTMEFRQHAATLDGSVVLPWLDFLLKLVQFCNTVREAEFAHLYNTQFQEVSWDTDPLLAVLDCEDETIEYYGHQQGRTEKGTTYAKEQARREMEQIDAFGDDDVSRQLMTTVLAENNLNSDIQAKTERLRLKVTKVGFGQLSDDLIEEIFGDCSEPFVERLRVGFVASEPSRRGTGNVDEYGMVVGDCGSCASSPCEESTPNSAIRSEEAAEEDMVDLLGMLDIQGKPSCM